MSFEKSTIQSSEIKPEEIKTPGGLTHKIFELGAKGGERTKSALRVLTLSMALSPVLAGPAEAGWFSKGKKEEPTIAQKEISPIREGKNFEDLTPEERQILIEAGALIPAKQEKISGEKTSLNLTKENTKEFFKKIGGFKNEVGREANLTPKEGELYSPTAKRFFEKINDFESDYLGAFPGIGEWKGNENDFQGFQKELREMQDNWFKIVTSPDYQKEVAKVNTEGARGWIKLNEEKTQRDFAREQMAYQYMIWKELWNSPHFRCENNIIVPRFRLMGQDKIVIFEMRRTERVNAPQLFGIISRYDSVFANYWLTMGAALDQGLDFFGNKLSVEQLKRARANYTKSVYYIASELCR